MSKKEDILNATEDLAGCFLYYDRKEDEDLPIGEIEKAIKAGDVSINEIVSTFENIIRKNI